jgi:hypothetical protein
MAMIEIRRGYLEPRAALRAARDELLAERDQLQARVAELEALVKQAYMEGYDAGWNGCRDVDSGGEFSLEDRAWESSTARVALEGNLTRS